MNALITLMIHLCGRSSRVGDTILVPSGARRTKDSGRPTTATPQRSIPQQRCRKCRVAGLSDLVVLAHRPHLSLGHPMVLPPGLNVTSILEAPQGWIDGAARQTGDGDDIEAVLVPLRDRLEHGRGRIRQGPSLHMTHSTYVARPVNVPTRRYAWRIAARPYLCGRLTVFWILRGTAGISWGQTSSH